MTAITQERVEELRGKVAKVTMAWRLTRADCADLLAILDSYSSLRAENEALNREMDALVISSDPVRMMRDHLIARAEKAETELESERAALACREGKP